MQHVAQRSLPQRAALALRQEIELTDLLLHAFDDLECARVVWHVDILDGKRGESEHEIVPGVALYEIAGPLFFGAAQNAMGAMGSVGSDTKVIVLALGGVPSIDATGFVALESALERLRAQKKRVVITGPLPQPRRVFDRANLPKHHEHLQFAETLERGLALARELIESSPPSVRTGSATSTNA